jgi:F-type H+-transporting ATPase subunit alpha
MELLKQPLYHPMSLAQQVITLCAANHEVFQTVPVKEVKRFQMDMLDFFEREHKEIIEEINVKKVLTDELEEAIVSAADTFKDRS